MRYQWLRPEEGLCLRWSKLLGKTSGVGPLGRGESEADQRRARFYVLNFDDYHQAQYTDTRRKSTAHSRARAVIGKE